MGEERKPRVKAVEGTVGRKTLSPRMKLVLWLYAIGLAKVTCVALLGAIASNLLQHAQVLLG